MVIYKKDMVFEASAAYLDFRVSVILQMKVFLFRTYINGDLH